jgi:hypothetical protein
VGFGLVKRTARSFVRSFVAHADADADAPFRSIDSIDMGGDDAYDHVVRGKLTLKGVAVKGGVGKKEKKRSKKEKREKKEKKEVRSSTTTETRYTISRREIRLVY